MTMPKSTTPFVAGLIAGAFIITVLGFSNDWVVTAESSNTQVKNASIDAQASICAALAEAHLKSINNTVSLEGYRSDARKARDDLAREFAVALPGEKAADAIVVTACAQILNKPKA